MAQKTNSAELILDAAEELFAQKGYDGVTVRSITNKADVQLNLLAYYFKTKSNLFETVVTRRLPILNERRAEALAKLDMDAATVKDILHAFIYPYLVLASSGEEGWKNYALLVAKITQSDDHLPILLNGMSESFADFLAACRQVLPDCSKLKITRGFLFTAALMSSTLSGVARIDGIQAAPSSDKGLQEVYEDLLNYCVAGFHAICR